MAERAKETFYGIPIKPLVLVLLTLQNSTVILTMRYSRTLPGPKYISSTAVVWSELIKCVLSFLVCYYIRLKTESYTPLLPEAATPTQATKRGRLQIALEIMLDTFSKKNGFFLLVIPAVLYTLQNNLIFVAASNLDAATFQVTYQGKLLTTAIFAVLILRQKLTVLRWVAVLTLTAGVATISYPSSSQADVVQPEGNRSVGLMAVGGACLISGFAGVYIEVMMKAAKDSGRGDASMIWVRNLQLSVSGLVLGALVCVAWDWNSLLEYGIFYGYNGVTWIVILLQAAGGIIVSLVITYADNILKSFATSLSVIISTVVSVMRQDTIVTTNLVIGVLLVLAATQLYSLQQLPKLTSSSPKVNSAQGAEHEKQNLLDSPESSNTRDSSDDEVFSEDESLEGDSKGNALRLKNMSVTKSNDSKI